MNDCWHQLGRGIVLNVIQNQEARTRDGGGRNRHVRASLVAPCLGRSNRSVTRWVGIVSS